MKTKFCGNDSRWCENCVSKGKCSSTVKIEPIDHDVLVLRFNCVIDKEIRDRISKEIREEYKTGLIFVPAYMDVYVVKNKKYIAKEE